MEIKTAFIFTFFLIYFTKTQECLIAEMPNSKGEWLSVQKQKRDVPRYFICGGEMNKFKKIQTFPQVCYRMQSPYSYWGISRPQFSCRKNPDIHEWTRSNGIRFRMCHFQRWEDQYNLQEHGDWEWQGMKMCPQNQMVWGYQFKISDRNGVSGLLLQCRNPYNVTESSKVLVVDEVSQEQWKTQYSKSGYAMGFKIKQTDGYIIGLSVEFTPMPQIFSFDFSYSYPNNLQAISQQIDNRLVRNKDTITIKQSISLTKQRQFHREWINQRNYLSNHPLQRYFSKNISTTSFKKSPIIQINSDPSKIESYKTTQEVLQKFSFGAIEKVIMKQQQRQQIYVGPCTIKIIQKIIYSTNMGIPYIAIIGYTNSFDKENDYFLGNYHGILSSSIKTIGEDIAIC